MSYDIELHGGPFDGETRTILHPPEGSNILDLGGAAYRVLVIEDEVGWGEYQPEPGQVPWVYNLARGAWERGDVLPASAPLTLGEATLAGMVFGALGLTFGLGLALVAATGLALDWIAGQVGGWLEVILGTTILTGIFGVVCALARPSMVREEADA